MNTTLPICDWFDCVSTGMLRFGYVVDDKTAVAFQRGGSTLDEPDPAREYVCLLTSIRGETILSDADTDRFFGSSQLQSFVHRQLIFEKWYFVTHERSILPILEWARCHPPKS